MSKKKMISDVDLKISNTSDEMLESIIKTRKKYNVEERKDLVKSLYFISSIDNEFTDIEKRIVNGTAYTLGIDDEALNDMYKDVDNNHIKSFNNSKKTPFKNELFYEMVDLTYAKGYQTSLEDKKLKEVAKAFGISDKKTESVMQEKYYQAQGIKQTSAIKSTAAKVGLGVGVVALGAAACALTAGAAAPAIGAILGNAAGLSGAAAAGHGLALLGGGALAAGGGGIAAGTTVVVTAGGIIGAGAGAFAASVGANIVNAYDKKQLKEYVKKELKNDKTKQEIVDNLVESIKLQKERISSLEKAMASERDLLHANEVVENLSSQKQELELLIEKENGK